MDEIINKELAQLKSTITSQELPVKQKKSLFLSLDKIDEWERSFHFVPKEIRDKVLRRNELRLQRLFEEADRIKEEVWESGWGLRDAKETVYVYRRRYFKEDIK